MTPPVATHKFQFIKTPPVHSVSVLSPTLKLSDIYADINRMKGDIDTYINTLVVLKGLLQV
jgi:hypothetical protein